MCLINDLRTFIEEKRQGRGCDGGDILYKDMARIMGISTPYLSDIINCNRKPPAFTLLVKMAEVLKLNEDERDELFDIAGRMRNTAAPDIIDYIMDKNYPSLRKAIRSAHAKGLGESYWNKQLLEIEQLVPKTD